MYSHTNLEYVTVDDMAESKRSQSVLVNQFHMNYQHERATIDCVLSDIINDVLALEGGEYNNSQTECSTPIENRNIRQIEADSTYDNRLQYWKNYLQTREDIKKRIKQYTNKKENEILLNKSQETDRTRLIKRIIDHSERLIPPGTQKLPVQLSKKSCTIYETLPKLERETKIDFEIYDIPQVTQKETNLPCCNVAKSSWLSSQILGSKICSNKMNIERLIQFYPDINELQVVGKQKTLCERNPTKMMEDNELLNRNIFHEPEIEFRIMDADSLRPKEKLPNYILILNDTILDYNKKEFNSFHFDIMFDVTVPFQKQKLIFLNIKNAGSKIIDLKWVPQRPRYKNISAIFNRLGSFTPSFYFDKNPFRLAAGGFKKKTVLFSCQKVGIYAETWILETEPNFLQNNAKIYCHLFGSCTPPIKYINKFTNLKSSLSSCANEIMAKNFVSSLAGCIPLPKPDPAYIHGFTDEELFVSMYPQMNVSNRFLDELKNLYRELRLYLPSPSIYPARWNFDIDEMKRMIFSIENEQDRKDYYERLIDIITNIKNLPRKQSEQIGEEEKFILVRSVILSTMERIDQLANELKGSLLETDLNLDFDEVLIMDREKVPETRRFSQKDYDNISLNSSKSYWVVKSESIRQKRAKLFHDTLYLQFAKHLGVMAEEIVAVIEGIKNIF